MLQAILPTNKKRALLLPVTAMLLVRGAHAQPPTDTVAEAISILETSEISRDELNGVLDLAVPENSLFTLMGTTPETVIRPKTGDKITASLAPQIADAFGNEAFAIAMEVSPSQFIMPKQFSFTDWRQGVKNEPAGELSEEARKLKTASWLEPLTLTFVANRSNEDSAQTQVGFGASYIYDEGAPIRKQREFETCVNAGTEDGSFDSLENEVSQFRVQIRAPVYSKAAAGFLAQENLSQLDRSKQENLKDYLERRVEELVDRGVGDSLEGSEFVSSDDVVANQEIIRGLIEYDIDNFENHLEEGLDKIYALLPDNLQVEVEEEVIAAGANSKAGGAFHALATSIAKECAEEFKAWNRNIYGAGVAVYNTSVSENMPSMTDEMMTISMMNDELSDVTGFGAWASVALRSPLTDEGFKSPFSSERGLSSNGQFTLHARYTNDLVRERGTGDDAITERVDAWSVAGRYTHEFSASENKKSPNARAFRGFIEAAYVEEDFSGISDEFWQAGIGAEVQLRKDLFVQFVVGDTFGSEIDRSTYLSGQFKWAFSKLPVQ